LDKSARSNRVFAILGVGVLGMFGVAYLDAPAGYQEGG